MQTWQHIVSYHIRIVSYRVYVKIYSSKSNPLNFYVEICKPKFSKIRTCSRRVKLNFMSVPCRIVFVSKFYKILSEEKKPSSKDDSTTTSNSSRISRWKSWHSVHAFITKGTIWRNYFFIALLQLWRFRGWWIHPYIQSWKNYQCCSIPSSTKCGNSNLAI